MLSAFDPMFFRHMSTSCSHSIAKFECGDEGYLQRLHVPEEASSETFQSFKRILFANPVNDEEGCSSLLGDLSLPSRALGFSIGLN